MVYRDAKVSSQKHLLVNPYGGDGGFIGAAMFQIHDRKGSVILISVSLSWING